MRKSKDDIEKEVRKTKVDANAIITTYLIILLIFHVFLMVGFYHILFQSRRLFEEIISSLMILEGFDARREEIEFLVDGTLVITGATIVIELMIIWLNIIHLRKLKKVRSE